MDFFTVPTLTFGALYCSFIIAHDRRRILHFNVTRHPTSSWTVQQLRQAFPYDSAPRFLLFDHDAKYGLEVPASIRSLKMTPVRTAIQSPWQNGVAERWVGSCRRPCSTPARTSLTWTGLTIARWKCRKHPQTGRKRSTVRASRFPQKLLT